MEVGLSSKDGNYERVCFSWAHSSRQRKNAKRDDVGASQWLTWWGVCCVSGLGASRSGLGLNQALAL